LINYNNNILKHLLAFAIVLFSIWHLHSQLENAPCTFDNIMAVHKVTNPTAEAELDETEKALQEIIKNLNEKQIQGAGSEFVIPVVMHVFHFGDDGKMDMEQIASGLKVLNDDFNGLNEGWNSVDSEFDSIKASLDITFCLAQLDPNGNPTTGVIYHEDSLAMLNQGDLLQHAWDNYKYLNIYFPKYTNGQPSVFTGYATFPSVINSDDQGDGIFYSSIRWGYGNHSELEEGDDWASVSTHEAGHWLNLRHTFAGACGDDDFVEDTPPTFGSGIQLSGCYNNDFSCGVRTNGENYMDYNHRCKKMFTQGQVERMFAALYLPTRITLWSEENLVATGCTDFLSARSDVKEELQVNIWPNPAQQNLYVRINGGQGQLKLFNSQGRMIGSHQLNNKSNQIDLIKYASGIYFYYLANEEGITSGRFLVQK